MNSPEENKAGEPPGIRVVRRGNIARQGGERSYGFIILLLAAVGILVYMKWFGKSGDGKNGEEGQAAAATAPGKPPSDSGRPGQYDIPIPSETRGR